MILKNNLGVGMEAVLNAEEIKAVQRAGVPYYFISTRRVGVPALTQLFEGEKWRF